MYKKQYCEFSLRYATIFLNYEESQDVSDEMEDVSYANSWFMTVLMVTVALLVTGFNIMLLTQIENSH